jgi:hypothetical protein
MRRASVCAVGITAGLLLLLLTVKAAAQGNDGMHELGFVAEGPDRAQIMLFEWVTVYDPVDDKKHTRRVEVCKAPCSPQLSPGTHELALRKGYEPFAPHSVVIPEGPATIYGKITSRRPLRIGLLVAGPISWAAGHITILATLLTRGANVPAGLGVGIPLAALGVSSYIAGLTLRDGNSIEVLPGVPAAASASGLTLRVRF